MIAESAIAGNVKALLKELPSSVSLEAAAKTRTPEEIIEAINAGVKLIGENFVQEAEDHYKAVGNRAEWHLIGHLQKNKVKKAVPIFDVIETVDSIETGKEIDKCCARMNKVMPVFIEVNSGREAQKDGVFPENTEALVRGLSVFKNVKVMGLMTMGPELHNPEELRPYFRETKNLLGRISALKIPGVEMKHVSMGMTDSYKIAIEEGATIVRIGTKIFGVRK